MRNWINLFESVGTPDIIQQAANGVWPTTLKGIEVFQMIVFIEASALDGPEDALEAFDIYLDEAEYEGTWAHLKNDSLIAHLTEVEIGSFEEPEFGVSDHELANNYSKLTSSAPPILIVNNKLQDGNHRMEAARKRKETYILAYVVS